MQQLFQKIAIATPSDTIAFRSLIISLSAVFVTILTFFGGLIFNYLERKRDIQRDVVLYKDIFTSWIETSKKLIEDQASVLNIFAAQIQNNQSTTPAPLAREQLMFEKLNGLAIEKIINLLIVNLDDEQNSKMKRFKILVSNVNFLDKLDNNIEKEFQNYTTVFNELSSRYNTLYKLSIRTIGHNYILAKSTKDQNNIRLCDFLMNIKKEWQKDLGNKEVTSTSFFSLVDNWLSLTNSIGDDFLNEFILEFIEILDELKIVEREWIAYKNIFHAAFSDAAKKMSTSFIQLNIASNELMKLNPKCVVKMR